MRRISSSVRTPRWPPNAVSLSWPAQSCLVNVVIVPSRRKDWTARLRRAVQLGKSLDLSGQAGVPRQGADPLGRLAGDFHGLIPKAVGKRLVETGTLRFAEIGRLGPGLLHVRGLFCNGSRIVRQRAVL